MPENIIIKSDDIVCVARGQAVVEARQAAESDCRVISVSASATVAPSEVFTGEARYIGKVKFDCIVFNGERAECITAVAEFSDKLTAPPITAGMSISLAPEIVNCEATVEGGAIKMTAVIDVTATAIVADEIACVSELAPGVYAERCSVKYCTAVAEQSETVYVNDSAECQKAADVMCVTSRAVVTGAEAADGEIKVSGNVYTFVTAHTDDGMITQLRIVTPFVKNVSAFGAGVGNIAYATADVTESTASIDRDGGRMETATTLTLHVTALDCRETEVVTDVFCADNEIEVKRVEAACRTVEPMLTVTDTVDGQVPLPADKLAADSVLCVCGTFCTLTDIKAQDKRVSVEGLVGGDIIYYNAEKNAIDTLAFRLPFSMPLSAHIPDGDVVATAEVTDVAVRVRRESVFDIKTEIAFTVRSSTQSTCAFVESVSIGEKIAHPDATVIVHIAREGETLWQAARALCCSPERVTEQNACAAPFAGGERLINFCRK